MKTITKFICAAFAAVTLATGAVTANDAVNDLFASVNGAANNGGGFIYQYNPSGVQSVFASGLSRPRGVAFDSAANLFVGTNFCDGTGCHPTILKITPGGVQSLFGTIAGDSFVSGLAIDDANNVFVVAGYSDPLSVTIYKFTPDGVQSTFALPPSIQSFGLAFDSAGNLYTAVNFETEPSQIWKYLPDGTSTVFATASSLSYGFNSLAFDRFGNLFVSTESNGQEPDTIRKFTPDGTESIFATNLNYPRGLAFDRAGNLFVAEIIQTGPGDILKFAPNGVGTVFASGIGPGGNGGPEFLAFQPVTPRARPTPHPRPTPPR